VLLDHFDVVGGHAIQSWVRVCDACLVHSQALQNLLRQRGLEVTVLITVLPAVLQMAEEVGNQHFHHCRSPLVGNGVGFRSLDKTVHNDQELLVSLLAQWEVPCYIDGYPFERDSEVVMMHLALIPGLWPATGCTGVELLAPLRNIISCLESVVRLLNFSRVLMTPK
jgi:hypothetical protein